MTVAILRIGRLVVSVPYLFLKTPGGVYQYRRRIPEAVRKHIREPRNGILMKSLATRDPVKAAKLALTENRKQEAYWASLDGTTVQDSHETELAALAMLARFNLRPGDIDLYAEARIKPDAFQEELEMALEVDDHEQGKPLPGPIQNFLPPVEAKAWMLYAGIAQPSLPTFSAATAFYKEFNSITKKAEVQECDRICAKVAEALGDKPLGAYTRDDANRLVKMWIGDGLSASSVQRYLNRLKAIVNTTRTEKTLNFPNVFEKLRIPKTPDRDTKRLTLSDVELERIREGCRLADDERRWIIALLMDTGARLAEIVGLRRQDVVLTGEVPHIVIVNHEGRTTKTKQSERKVPLVGMALWGAERAMRAGNGEALFPSYVDAQGQANATSASAALIKWLRGSAGLSGAGKTVHSLRHTMRDRMRAAGVPEDVQNQLGGWAGSGSVGSRYGEWGLLKVLREHMRQAAEVARE